MSEVVVIGGGPAGLSATLNLARALVDVVLVDASRPRNAATLRSHGFLTRDGIRPTELRSLAKEELAPYENVEFLERRTVTSVRRTPDGFAVDVAGRAPGQEQSIATRAVLLTTGLTESLPALPSIRAYYGMSVFSCVACDAWDLRGKPLALIGETDDLARRAVHLSRWTDDLTVFTNASPVVSDEEEAALAAAGIRVERTRIADLEGERGAVRSVLLQDGRSVPIEGGFVRPGWTVATAFIDDIDPERSGDGFLVVDEGGRTSIPGLYAAGDVTVPGPQQMIIAAGAGARAAAAIVDDLQSSAVAARGGLADARG
ncbi:NAD(P)/FAD-dependent oxidoreductase [Leifsonia sp. AG29]|uniref:NAD(P)/FAD-dependent oxidoreductase n=1 Tax=Leifsonia sp. AG29 TaxID=2598860 RepID=UPI00131D7232|nr:NAD(P)/FAD-dependent oxidoreductase [Leifsonia sp. AG29]